jgi:ribosomal protein S14
MYKHDSFDKGDPYEWLKKFKVNHPTECRICGNSAYYHSKDLGELCAVHFLDLANVGQLYWKWDDWEDVWSMMGRLLSRQSTTVETPSHVVLRRLVVLAETSDGYKRCQTCGERKELIHYSKNKYKVDGINTVCKPCDNTRRRAKHKRKQ